MHPVRNDVDLFRRAAEPLGDLPIVLEQRIEVICRVVRETRKIIKIANPDALEIRLCPVALDDLRLALTRVDPVLGNHIRLVVERRRHRTDHAAVARCDTVVHIRLGQFLLEQVKERQEHRAHRPEKIREREIVILLTIDPHDDIKEIARHKDCERRFPATVVKNLCEVFQRHVPLPAHKLVERLLLLPREDVLHHLRAAQGENFIQKCLLDPDAVLGQLILEFTAILRLRTDGVNDKLMLRQSRHEHLNPRGHPAHDVGVAPLRENTDPHQGTSFQ